MITISVILEKQIPSFEKACRIFQKHSRAFRFTDAENADILLTLELSGELSSGAFRLRGEKREWRLTGGDLTGLLSGIGYLLRTGKAGFTDYVGIPEKAVRGIYFANHFFNYYHAAPLEKIRNYLEDLALWGCNALELWFDMHHFSSVRDAKAVAMLERMKQIFSYAKELGMKIGLMELANEYYTGADAGLLAENSTDGTGYSGKLRGFYFTELCPSKPEGRRKLLASRREVLEYFRDLSPDYVCVWPYDQGGCTCRDCYPWGANGFRNLAKEESTLIRELCPQAKIILSTWRFDAFTAGEWNAFDEKLAKDHDWIDYLMVEQNDAARARLSRFPVPVIDFPDISMYGAVPWGGFGANPISAVLEKQYFGTEKYLTGGFAYSEGIFEDVNKFLMLQFYAGGKNTAQILREYAFYRFGEEQTDEIAELLASLCETLPRQRYDGDVPDNFPAVKPDTLPRFVIEHPERVAELCEKAEAIHRALPDAARQDPFWRMIYLRTKIDLALVNNGGVPNGETDRCCDELTAISYADDAFYYVSPITRRSIFENRGNSLL